MKDVDLAPTVVAWLRDEGWDVHQEVNGIDILAMRDGRL